MENRQNTTPEGDPEPRTVAREERTQELIQGIRMHLGQGDLQSALALFNALYPVDQAEVLSGLARGHVVEIVADLAPNQTGEILDQMEPEEAVKVAIGLESEALSRVLDETSPDVAADILRLLPEETSQVVLEAMDQAQGVIPLLEYPDDTAGGLMTPDYTVVKEGTTAGNALDQLRLLGPDAENISSVFVVDNQQVLLGSLSVTRLALARASSLVADLADRELLSIGTSTDQEECARLMERYDLSQLPVLDGQGRLVGIILAEDMVDVVEEEATEDMYRIASLAGERVFGPLHQSLRNRLPWLYINLATAFLAALVISLFESTISRVVALAIFLPVVASQGGIGGTQTVTLVVRSIALGDLPSQLGRRLLARELLLGLLNGVLLGVVVGLATYAWKGNFVLGIILGVAMLGNMLVAGLAGAGVPLLLRQLRMDPAVSSAVFVTTFTDVIGFLLFLGLAAAFVDSLL